MKKRTSGKTKLRVRVSARPRPTAARIKPKSTRRAPRRSLPEALSSRGAKRRATIKKLRPVTPPSHVHPYGTATHPDFEWHLSKLQKYAKRLPQEQQEKINRAYELANERHGGQTRYGGSPYIIHPVRIANILISEWSVHDANVIAAAILHDVVEDTQTTIKEIKDAFGDDIGRLVDGMTMWKGSETYELYCKRVTRGSGSLRLIKCADILDNLRSWHELFDSDKELPRLWRQANDYILPMADNTYPPAGMAIRSLLNDEWYLMMAEME